MLGNTKNKDLKLSRFAPLPHKITKKSFAAMKQFVLEYNKLHQ